MREWKPWTKEEDEFLRKNYLTTTHREISQKLDRSQTAVSQRLWAFKLKKDNRREWTGEEDEFLRQNYPKMKAPQIGAKLQRTSQSVWTRAKILQIEKGCINKFDDTPSPALAYVLGTVKGDGCVSHSKRAYIVCLGVKDRCFAESFRDALIAIELKPYKIYESRKIIRYNVRASSKSFYDWYNKLSFQSVYNLLETNDMKKEFVRGFYESEGSFSVVKHRWCLEISNKNKELLELVQRLIKDIGFSSAIKRIVRSSGFVKGEIFRLRLLGGQTEIARFLQEIKPCIPRKSLGKYVPTSSPHRRWAARDTESLIKNHKSMTFAEIARKLGRERAYVHKKAKELGLKAVFCGRGKRWTGEEINFVKTNCQSMPWGEIAKKLGRSYSSVAQKIRGLGLKKGLKFQSSHIDSRA